MFSGTGAAASKALLGMFLLLLGLVPRALGQADLEGQWSTASYQMPINAIHIALMHNGKLLIIAGSGNCPPSQAGCPSGAPFGPSNNSGALVLDPGTGSITRITLSWDMFCNGMVVLPDGRPFINGGTLVYDPFHGTQKSAVFDPATNTFTDVSQKMAHGRWYPTVTVLGDGRIMTFSGVDENGSTNTTVEIYTVGTGWSSQYSAGWTPPLYPRMTLLPSGKVFYSGSDILTRLFDPSKHTWSTVGDRAWNGERIYESTVLLPLTPANNFRPKVMTIGGGYSPTSTTELIDMGASSPAWVLGPSMSQHRIEQNAVLLPNQKLVVVGGSSKDEDPSTASLNADLYDPESNSFSSAGANVYPRLYHSNALLLPDATVWVGGSNPVRGQWEPHVEIYKPAYLFTRDGNNNIISATRPTITSVPGNIAWGGGFTVSTPDAANISSVVLIRPGAPTHATDMEQRLVGMSFTKNSSSLSVTAPSNGNLAPPGYYMLFIVNSSGVPSVAKFVQLGSTGSNPAPTVTSVSPSSGTTAGGTAVTITGTGFRSGATVTFGGNAATGVTVASSTSITANTPSHAAGAVNVVVTNTDSQKGTLTNGYTYTSSNTAPTVTAISPTSGTPNGGTGVTITGTGFRSGATVSFGGNAATGVTVASSTSITATTPAHSAGAVNVVVTNTDSQKGTLTNGYTYTSTAPTVTSISPSSGLTSGGTSVTLTGSRFASGATASFGGTAATGVTVASSTSITATTPAHSAGAVSVVVTNTDGQSGTLSSAYTYLAPADFTLTASGLSPTTVTAGGSATATITVTPVNGFQGNLNLSCGSVTPAVNLPPTCSFTPSSLAGSGTATLTVHTTAATQGWLTRPSRNAWYAMWLPLAGLLMIGTGFASRKARCSSLPLACLMLASLILLMGCGSGGASFGGSGTGGNGGVAGTPAGTYTITVSASGSMSHTTPVSLTVN